VDAIRTPDVLLEGLPGFPWAPRFRSHSGLRLAHIDEGDGPPVVLWHGEPTWSFLWRKVAPPLLEAGHRVILPDLPGFGRSDKPLDRAWYSYDRFTAAMADLLERLDLRGATVVCHDWGGPIGLRLAVEHADRVDRIVAMDTGLFTGRQPMSEAWHRFARFVADVEELPVGFLVRRGCLTDPGDAVAAAYDAPFVNEAAKAGARAFPPLVLKLQARSVLEALRDDKREMLLLWGAQDRPLPIEQGEAFAAELGRPAPRPIPDAGHFLQEDQGERIGALIADWLT
jgi:haloalkane dehalogenase